MSELINNRAHRIQTMKEIIAMVPVLLVLARGLGFGPTTALGMSIGAAYVGGTITLPASYYNPAVGGGLFCAAIRMLLIAGRPPGAPPHTPPLPAALATGKLGARQYLLQPVQMLDAGQQRLAREARGVRGLSAARAVHHPDGNAAWWWRLAEEVRARRGRARRARQQRPAPGAAAVPRGGAARPPARREGVRPGSGGARATAPRRRRWRPPPTAAPAAPPCRAAAGPAPPPPAPAPPVATPARSQTCPKSATRPSETSTPGRLSGSSSPGSAGAEASVIRDVGHGRQRCRGRGSPSP